MTAAFTIERRRDGRSWEVRDAAGELVCVTLYRCGALEVARRLSLLAAEMHAPQSGSPGGTGPKAAEQGAARVCGERRMPQKVREQSGKSGVFSGNTSGIALQSGNCRAKGLPPGTANKAGRVTRAPKATDARC